MMETGGVKGDCMSRRSSCHWTSCTHAERLPEADHHQREVMEADGEEVEENGVVEDEHDGRPDVAPASRQRPGAAARAPPGTGPCRAPSARDRPRPPGGRRDPARRARPGPPPRRSAPTSGRPPRAARRSGTEAGLPRDPSPLAAWQRTSQTGSARSSWKASRKRGSPIAAAALTAGCGARGRGGGRARGGARRRAGRAGGRAPRRPPGARAGFGVVCGVGHDLGHDLAPAVDQDLLDLPHDRRAPLAEPADQRDERLAGRRSPRSPGSGRSGRAGRDRRAPGRAGAGSAACGGSRDSPPPRRAGRARQASRAPGARRRGGRAPGRGRRWPGLRRRGDRGPAGGASGGARGGRTSGARGAAGEWRSGVLESPEERGDQSAALAAARRPLTQRGEHPLGDHQHEEAGDDDGHGSHDDQDERVGRLREHPG